MSCGSCGNKKKIIIFESKVDFNKNIFSKYNDMVGDTIMTTTGRVGTVIENRLNSYDEVIGYILKDESGDRFTIFKHQFLNKI